MPAHRPPIICNRFEVVVLVLLCFIISTRLIWLQIDDRNRTLTDEFYATSLFFTQSPSNRCPVAPDPAFPDSANFPTIHLDSGALTSPGLGLALVGLCQFKRVSMDSLFSYAPILIGLSSFLIAITSRILTSNWVGGMFAAAVVLSRGTILQGTHLAGTFLFLQPIAALLFLLIALYARTRSPQWLPWVALTSLLSVYVSPLFSLVVWPLNAMIGIRLFRQARRSYANVQRLPLHLFSIVFSFIAIPLLILKLNSVEPSSTRGVSTFIHQLSLVKADGGSAILLLIGSAMAIFEQQDMHWLASFGLLGLAATWKRFLPRGSGFWALALVGAAAAALLVDGGLTAAAARQTSEQTLRRLYSMTDAVFGLEPIIIGAGACYAWFAVRYIIILIFPSYISVSHQHDNVK
jgi:hypothetical protein